MTKPTGRPPGLILHTEAFEALIQARGMLKKDVAETCGLSASFLADLLAKRGGASSTRAQAIADALRVPLAVIFPESAGWVSPLPDREAKRVAA